MEYQTITQLFDLTGKGAIVTGAGMGIGRAIAFRLAEAGAGVMVADIDMEAANKAVEQIKGKGGIAKAIRADASSETDAENVTQATVEAFGSLDILVNNAGIFPHSPVLEVGRDMWDKVLDINVKGVYFYARAAADTMIKAGSGGKIINIASMEGLHPRKDLVHYVTSKGGVVILTQALALELAQYNILVNAVAPGGIMTPGAAVQGQALKAMGRSLNDITNEFMARLPLGRMGQPDDVARVVVFLASAAADYMTGSVVVADGGYLLS